MTQALHLKPADLAGLWRFQDVAGRVKFLMSTRTVMGHNLRRAIAFLHFELRRANLAGFGHLRVLDVRDVFAAHLKTRTPKAVDLHREWATEFSRKAICA